MRGIMKVSPFNAEIQRVLNESGYSFYILWVIRLVERLKEDGDDLLDLWLIVSLNFTCNILMIIVVNMD
jgi:hypothetical protein